MMAYEAIAVYILASAKNGTLYIGVTSHLIRRTYEHRQHVMDGFTKKYGVTMLVYYELYETMDHAIHREKRLKKYTRQQKIKLIEKDNPAWLDRWNDIIG